MGMLLRQKNNNIKILIMVFTTICFGALAWFYNIKFYSTTQPSLKEKITGTEAVTGMLEEGDLVEQKIQFVGDIYGIAFQIGTYGKVAEGTLEIELSNSEGDIGKEILDLSEVRDMEKCAISFDEAIVSAEPGDCVLRIYIKELGEATTISLMGDADAANEMDLKESKIYYNYVATGNRLGLSILGIPRQVYEISRLFIIFMICLWLAVMIVETLLMFFHIKIHQAFLAIAVLFITLYQLVLPPLTAPDEDAHASMAYYYSNFLWGEMESEPIGTGKFSYIPSRETETGLLEHPIRPGGEDYLELIDSITEENSFDAKFNGKMRTRLINASAVTYFPQSFGVTLARLLHLNGTLTLYMGRFFSSIAYIVLCYFGIKMMPSYQCALALVSLLPMSLHLGASYSYDSILLGGAVFFTGLVFRLYDRKTQMSIWDWGGLLLSALILTAGKGIYILLLGLCLIIPWQAWGGKFSKIWKLLVFYGGALIMFAVNMMPLLLYRVQKEPAKEMLNSGIILKRPLEFIWLVLNTLVERLSWYLQSMLGGYLGWFDVTLPTVIVYMALLLLLLGAIRTSGTQMELTFFARIVCIAVFLAIGGGCIVAALSWNEATVLSIDGVQGRYLLQPLPALIIGISGWKGIELKRNLDRWLLLGIGAVNACALITAFNTIASR